MPLLPLPARRVALGLATVVGVTDPARCSHDPSALAMGLHEDGLTTAAVLGVSPVERRSTSTPSSSSPSSPLPSSPLPSSLFPSSSLPSSPSRSLPVPVSAGGWHVAACPSLAPVPSLRFVDVGQGAALVVDGGGDDVVVIDSGPPSGGEALLKALDDAGISRVGLWVHTHFDADHVGGVARVLAGLDGTEGTLDDVHVALAWDRGANDLPPTEVVDVYFASRLGSTRHVPSAGETWRSGDATVRLLRPPEDVPLAGENTRGLAACVELGGMRVLVLGDLPSAIAEAVAADCPDVDLLWVGHHGSSDAISEDLVEITSPDAAIVSAGDDNPYCHPAPVTTALLAEVPTYYTGVAATDPAAPCGDLALRWPEPHHWVASDLCVSPVRGQSHAIAPSSSRLPLAR